MPPSPTKKQANRQASASANSQSNKGKRVRFCFVIVDFHVFYKLIYHYFFISLFVCHTESMSIVWHLLQGESPPWFLACRVERTVEYILLLSVSFTNCSTINFQSGFLKVATLSLIYLIKETEFYHEILVNVFTWISLHLSFYQLHILCVYKMYQHLHCSYFLFFQ